MSDFGAVQSTDQPGRGVCEVCRRTIGLKKDGKLRVHTNLDAHERFMNCSGSARWPSAGLGVEPQ